METKLKVNTAVFDELLAKYPLRGIPKNRPLLYQGEIPTMCFYVKSGVIKAYNITTEGDEKIVGYESDGTFLPAEWLFNRAPVALYYYDTLTECQVSRIPRDELIDFINDHKDASLFMLDKTISSAIGSVMHLHALEQSKASSKLLYIMQYLALRFGEKTNGVEYKIKIRLTHQEIANLIGITRETTSNEMNKLAKQGIIKIDNSLYIVDTNAAQRLLGENEFKELSL